jgi:hypothetical protein
MASVEKKRMPLLVLVLFSGMIMLSYYGGVHAGNPNHAAVRNRNHHITNNNAKVTEPDGVLLAAGVDTSVPPSEESFEKVAQRFGYPDLEKNVQKSFDTFTNRTYAIFLNDSANNYKNNGFAW